MIPPNFQNEHSPFVLTIFSHFVHLDISCFHSTLSICPLSVCPLYLVCTFFCFDFSYLTYVYIVYYTVRCWHVCPFSVLNWAKLLATSASFLCLCFSCSLVVQDQIPFLCYIQCLKMNFRSFNQTFNCRIFFHIFKCQKIIKKIISGRCWNFEDSSLIRTYWSVF